MGACELPLANSATRERASSRDSACSSTCDGVRGHRKAFEEAFQQEKSIYLIASVEEGEHAIPRTKFSLIAFLALMIQSFVAITCVVELAKESTVLAPGFRDKASGSGRRGRWTDHYLLDFTAATLLGYLAMLARTTYERKIRLFRLALKARRVHCGILVLGALAVYISTACAVLIPYLRFRQAHVKTPGMLVGLLSVEFIINVDDEIIARMKSSYQTRLRVERATRRLGEMFYDLKAAGVIHDLAVVSNASVPVLLARCPCTDALQELFSRLFGYVFDALCFSALVLAATGGHIAHYHFTSFVWYLGLAPAPRPGETPKILLLSSASKDGEYWLAAIVNISIFAAVFKLVALASRHRLRPTGAQSFAPGRWTISRESTAWSEFDIPEEDFLADDAPPDI